MMTAVQHSGSNFSMPSILQSLHRILTIYAQQLIKDKGILFFQRSLGDKASGHC